MMRLERTVTEEETMTGQMSKIGGKAKGRRSNFKAGMPSERALRKDVLHIHAEQTFHVMMGGGDQVYCNAVHTRGPLKSWAELPDPRQRQNAALDDTLKTEIDDWYFENYRTGYSAETFRQAAASIPSIQIFDDHDIIDGFGSYQDQWMRAPIFLGIGDVAWKYYMLFQQHTPPRGEDPEDPFWVLGGQRGPYIQEYSRSVCATLGKRVISYGLDCRVDRTLERMCCESTYEAMWDRLDRDVVRRQTKHLILLLVAPTAYPRLVWLEKMLTSQKVIKLVR